MRFISPPFFLIFFLFLAHRSDAQQEMVKKTSADGRFSWTEASNDPQHTRFYTLKNGLTVILSENHEKPQVASYVTTRVGSKNDPADHTGLAHYLEHMLFKGTDKFGALDYGKEKVELAKIVALYEKYGKTQEPAARKALYHLIDSISGVAASYCIANEYDKMTAALGASGTNAWTSVENTSYTDIVPSNVIRQYLQIQGERFRNPVMRLFHTELEAVYEEKNRNIDNGWTQIYENMFKVLYPNHPYGTQTTIGTIEHLKNPSLVAIQQFYDQWYVPNNMALILVGDFNSDEVIAMAEECMGNWLPKPISTPAFPQVPAMNEVKTLKIITPDDEKVCLGFRCPESASKEEILGELVFQILNNGKAGLIDKDLVLSQKVLSAWANYSSMNEYGFAMFGGQALAGQSLEDVKNLLLAEIQKIKTGDFDESMIQSVANNYRRYKIEMTENIGNMRETLNSFYVMGGNVSWAEYLARYEQIKSFTKKDVMDFANRWLGDNNYVLIYKLTGQDPTRVKVEKPEIHPVPINKEAQSDFFRQLMSKPATPIKPSFVDFDKDMGKVSHKSGMQIWHVPNKMNKLFNLSYVFEMGSLSSQKLALAVDYLKYIGSETMSNDSINKVFYAQALDFGVYSDRHSVSVYLNGLDEAFDQGIALLENIINKAKADPKALDLMINAKLKARNDDKLNKSTIFWSALNEYLNYGPKNPFNDVLSEAELRAITANELTDILHGLTQYVHTVRYYGPRSLRELNGLIAKYHVTPEVLKQPIPERKYHRETPAENTVYLVDYDMVQAEILMSNWTNVNYSAEISSPLKAFNEYYGGNMGSVVFQDIRESKALAYSTFASVNTPYFKTDPLSVMFYTGTQADKISEAIPAMQNLLDNMPKSEKAWENTKQSIKAELEAHRTTKMGILDYYDYCVRMGFNHDIRRDQYNALDGLSLQTVSRFHEEQIKNKHWNIGIMSSRKQVKPEDVKKFGNVIELDLKTLFGY